MEQLKAFARDSSIKEKCYTLTYKSLQTKYLQEQMSIATPNNGASSYPFKTAARLYQIIFGLLLLEYYIFYLGIFKCVCNFESGRLNWYTNNIKKNKNNINITLYHWHKIGRNKLTPMNADFTASPGKFNGTPTP